MPMPYANNNNFKNNCFMYVNNITYITIVFIKDAYWLFSVIN